MDQKVAVAKTLQKARKRVSGTWASTTGATDLAARRATQPYVNFGIRHRF